MSKYKKMFDSPIECLIEGCGAVFEPGESTRSAGSAFSAHLQHDHNIKAEDYTVNYIYGGVRPTCEACGSCTRYACYSFKKFCKDHARLAMSSGGKRGGVAPSPLRGMTKENSEVLARLSESMTGENNPFYGRSHTEESIKKIVIAKTLPTSEVTDRLHGRIDEWTCLTPMSEYTNRQDQYLEFRCNKCGAVSMMTLQTFERGSLCKTCYACQVSVGQKEVADWIRSTGYKIELSTRRVISPLELDVYVPDAKFAVEYHGLYYHSEAKDPKINRGAMLKKHDECRKQGIKLFQVLANEWRDKRSICESMMTHALGLTSRRAGARDLGIVALDKETAREFFEDNHVGGSSRCAHAWGLIDANGELLSALSVRRPQGSSKWREGDVLEIARFAQKKNVSVSGALGKLTSVVASWARENCFVSVLTYADLRFGTGAAYERVGFKHVGTTGVGFCWTDLKTCYPRQRCKADASIGLTEKDHALRLGWSKVWLPGNAVYVLDTSPSREVAP